MSAPTFAQQPSLRMIGSDAALADISFQMGSVQMGSVQMGSVAGVNFQLQKQVISSGTDASNNFVDVSGATFDVSANRVIVTITYSMASIKDTVVFRIRATNTNGSTNSNTVTLSPPAKITPAELKNFADASVTEVKALLAAPPASLKQLIKNDPLSSTQLADLAATFKKANANGEASIVIDGTKIIIPEIKNGKLVAPVSAGSNKIRIPDGVTQSDVIVINAAETTVQYKGLRGTPSVRYFEVKEVGKAAVQLNDGESITLSNGTNLELSWGSINIDVDNDGNSFPAYVNPYLAIQNVLIYTKATVDALVAGNALPATPRVAWAPLGVTAGSLMRALQRVVVVADAEGRHLQRWVRIQYINGVGSEGVDDTLADYGCGWICVWDASGVAPVY